MLRKFYALLNFNFIMIYILYKTSLLLKNCLNYIKDSVSKRFLKEYNRPLCF